MKYLEDKGYLSSGEFDAKPTNYTKGQLGKMLEKDVVALANNMGLDASVDDLKADTIQKILDHQAKN